MRVLLAVLALILISIASAPAQAQKRDGDAKADQELRKLVQAWDEAYVKGDTATLDRLLASEFTFVGGPSKADYLASFKSRAAAAIESAMSTDIQVQVYDDAAVLTGLDTITGKNNGQSYVVKWLYMDVWIKRGGRWQCVKTYASPAK